VEWLRNSVPLCAQLCNRGDRIRRMGRGYRKSTKLVREIRIQGLENFRTRNVQKNHNNYL